MGLLAHLLQVSYTPFAYPLRSVCFDYHTKRRGPPHAQRLIIAPHFGQWTASNASMSPKPICSQIRPSHPQSEQWK